MVVDKMTGPDLAQVLRLWIGDNRSPLEAQGVEVSFDESPDSAGSDPVAWLDLFKGTRGGRIAVWRVRDVELELAEVETGEVTQHHFVVRETAEMKAIVRRLTLWVGAAGLPQL